MIIPANYCCQTLCISYLYSSLYKQSSENPFFPLSFIEQMAFAECYVNGQQKSHIFNSKALIFDRENHQLNVYCCRFVKSVVCSDMHLQFSAFLCFSQLFEKNVISRNVWWKASAWNDSMIMAYVCIMYIHELEIHIEWVDKNKEI